MKLEKSLLAKRKITYAAYDIEKYNPLDATDIEHMLEGEAEISPEATK